MHTSSIFVVTLVLTLLRQTPPSQGDPYLNAGIKLIEGGDFETAVNLLEALVRDLTRDGKGPDAETARLFLATALLNQGEETRARSVVAETLKNNPSVRPDPRRYPGRLVQLVEDVRGRTSLVSSDVPSIISALIEQLAAPSVATRRSAIDGLAALGDAALPALREAAAASSPDNVTRRFGAQEALVRRARTAAELAMWTDSPSAGVRASAVERAISLELDDLNLIGRALDDAEAVVREAGLRALAGAKPRLLSLRHRPSGCAPEMQFGSLSVEIPGGAEAPGRLFFRSNLREEWFYTDLPRAKRLTAVLPKINRKGGISEISYVFEARDVRMKLPLGRSAEANPELLARVESILPGRVVPLKDHQPADGSSLAPRVAWEFGAAAIRTEKVRMTVVDEAKNCPAGLLVVEKADPKAPVSVFGTGKVPAELK